MDDTSGLRAEIEALRGRMRVLIGAIVVLAAATALMGFHMIEEILGEGGPLETSEVRIVGEDGTVRARLGTAPMGDAQLTLSDAAGAERLWLKAGDTHGTFEITDASRHVQVRLSAIENLSGLHLAHGSQTAQMAVSTESTALTLVDLDHSLSAVLRADPAGTDLQLSRNTTGEPPRLASLSAGPDDTQQGATLMLAGPKQFLEARVDAADGEPRLVIAGETRIESRTGADEPPWQRFERAP